MRRQKRGLFLLVIAGCFFAIYPNISAAQDQDARALYEQGTRALKQGQYSSSADLLERALKARPDMLSARVNLSIALAYSGGLERAIALMAESVRKAPDPGEKALLLYNLGSLYRHNKDSGKARECYERSLQQAPNFVQPLLSLAQEFSSSDPAKAKELFLKGNRTDSFMPDLPSIVPVPSRRVGENSYGFPQNEPPVYIYHSPAWLLSRAIHFIEGNEPQKAREQIDLAIAALDPASPLQSDRYALVEVYVYKGNSYAIEKDLDKALEAFLKACDVDATHSGALTNVALVYFVKGDRASCLRYLDRALTFDPRYGPALRLRKRVSTGR